MLGNDKMNIDVCSKKCSKYCSEFSTLQKVKYILKHPEDFGHGARILYPSNLARIDKIFESRCYKECEKTN